MVLYRDTGGQKFGEEKQSHSLKNKKPHGTTLVNGFQVVRPRRQRATIQRESLAIVSDKSGSDSNNDGKGISQSIRHKEHLELSNPNSTYNEILENTGRKDLQLTPKPN